MGGMDNNRTVKVKKFDFPRLIAELRRFHHYEAAAAIQRLIENKEVVIPRDRQIDPFSHPEEKS